MSQQLAVVTGGAGFVGSHMVDLLLEQGFRVHVIDSLVGGRLENLDRHRLEPRVSFEQKDIRDLVPQEPSFRNAAYVFHFAGIGDIVPSIENPVEYLSTNHFGTVKTLEAARHAGLKKFVYAASSSCYGMAQVPTNESAPIQLDYPYALSKFQGEQAVFHWGKLYRMPVNSVCIFNAYGPRFRTSGSYGSVFGVFLAQKANGKPFTRVGDGNQRRDWVFVSDVVRAFHMVAASAFSNERFNVGTGNPQSINRLIELLQGEVINIPRRPGEPETTWADISKIRQLLGWEPQFTLEQGVEVMLQNLDYWKEAPVWDVATIAKATDAWFSHLSR